MPASLISQINILIVYSVLTLVYKVLPGRCCVFLSTCTVCSSNVCVFMLLPEIHVCVLTCTGWRTTLLLSELACTCACAQGWVIRVALELYKKSLTVKTIVQTPWFQRCSTTACAARADWTRALERGRETSSSQHPAAVHLPLSLLLPSLSFVRRKEFEHQRAAMLPWRQ